MKERIDFLSPIGRLVQGSLYDPNTTDAEGNLLTIKRGASAGQNRVEFFFSIAVQKGQEQHWVNTAWGAIIYNAGLKAFPNGQTQNANFAWKVKDGDSQVPVGDSNRRPCDREGFAGHWIVSFKSMFAPQTFEKTQGKLRELPQKDAINLGDYVQIYGNIVSNGSSQQPGVIINHRFVTLMGYGERIFLGPDPESVGFGGALPAGASAIPLGAAVASVIIPDQPVVSQAVVVPTLQQVPAAPAPTPYPQILNIPAAPVPPAPPIRKMTAKAAGFTYDQLIGTGQWTDQLLIQHGYMEP